MKKRLLLSMGGTEFGWSRHNDQGVFRDYELEVQRLFESAKPWGLECIKFDNDYMLNSLYYPLHKDVMDRVSFGFTFRPIAFYDTLSKCKDGDIALFTDSNHVIAKDPTVFFEIAEKHGMFVHDHLWVQYPNKDWTRRDTFVNMGCDEERYWNSLQMQGNILAICKNDKTMEYIKEWLNCSFNHKIMFGENKYPNFPTFQEHRHDQSIISILREKYEFPYVVRNDNVWLEYVIPELDGITPQNPIDNHWRMEEDRKDIR